MAIEPESLTAYGFALCAHRKQKRKYTGDPYVTHCLNVARILSGYTLDTRLLSAALLHDTLEDTDVTAGELREAFGGAVLRLVLEVTDVSKPEDGNRQKRKEIDRVHLAQSSPEGATIKLADMIDNTSSILTYDRDFARVYIPEKRAVLGVLKHGDPALYAYAEKVLDDAERELARAV